MKEEIRFSIIIPNYNKGEYIEECLKSVYNQTYKNYEVIVIDDGSTDNSLEEIKKFQIDMFLQTNRKQAGGARNLGIANAKGDYVVFLDSDDYLTNNKVLKNLANIINDEDVIFLNYTRDKFGEIIEYSEKTESLDEKIETTNLGCPTKCFKKELIKDVLFSEEKRFEDICFVLEALCKAKTHTYFRESFFTYRQVRQSNYTSPMDANGMLDMLYEFVKMYRLCVKYPDRKESLMKRIKKDRLALRLEVLDHLIETGENKYREFF